MRALYRVGHDHNISPIYDSIAVVSLAAMMQSMAVVNCEIEMCI